ncbi:MAG TPA: LCP family protein [Acidimicrobiales bacterium]|nr:LCP family protein [Acidimicrobiales bacterium]
MLAAGTAIVLVCLLGASLGTYLVVKYGSIQRADVSLPQAPPGEPENFLIVAVDTREGHSGVNTDTIMVLRVDPKSDRLALTSFPRDLIVTVADTGERGMINAVYNRPDNQGPQNLIDTLQQNFGITINHFVEVNFDSFRRVVESVGGVPVFMERAARDKGSGFYNEQLGCVNLNGEDALEFVRSRKLEVLIDGEWRHDPLSDVNRVKRQQIFIQRAMSKVLSQVKDNPLYLHELIDIGVDTVTLDPNLGISDLRDLGERFRDFDPAELETYPLPVIDHPSQPGRLLLDEAEAEPILNVFRGLDPSEISPSRVKVRVLNGTVADPAQQRENLASDVSAALQQVGFTLQQPGDADTFYAQTTIQHAPGQELFAQRVARHITSETAIPTEANPELGSGEVVVIAGADFTTVHEVPTPVDQMPPPAGAPAAGEEPGSEAPETTAPPETTTTTSPPPTTTTTENPFIIGQPPEGARC